jgi:hypothetical protein
VNKFRRVVFFYQSKMSDLIEEIDLVVEKRLKGGKTIEAIP